MAPKLSTLSLLSGVSKVMNGPAASKQSASLVQKSSAVKNPRQLLRLPPINEGGGKPDKRNSGATTAAAAAAVPSGAAERAGRAARARMLEALARRVAWRMPKRGAPSTSPPLADEGTSSQNVLACCCARLPPELRWALHQAGASGRSWMRMQRGGNGDGGRAAGEASGAMPRECGRDRGWAFSEYARWRRHVWMPSRFYLERLEQH